MIIKYHFDGDVSFGPPDPYYHQSPDIQVAVVSGDRDGLTIKLRVDRGGFHDGWSTDATPEEITELIDVLQRALAAYHEAS